MTKELQPIDWLPNESPADYRQRVVVAVNQRDPDATPQQMLLLYLQLCEGMPPPPRPDIFGISVEHAKVQLLAISLDHTLPFDIQVKAKLALFDLMLWDKIAEVPLSPIDRAMRSRPFHRGARA